MSYCDIHSHILPGVDDGSDSIERTVEMLNLAVKSNISRIVATPHSYVDTGGHRAFLENLSSAFKFTSDVIEREKIPVQLLSGMEVLADYEFDERLENGYFLTLNGTKNLLLEFSFHEPFNYMESVIKKVFRRGYTPVIAHPERYEDVQDNPERMKIWTEAGCILQINKGSFINFFGQESKKCAMTLLKKGYVSLIASDAHSSEKRTPYIKNIADFLDRYFGKGYADILLDKNPNLLVDGKELIKPRVFVK